MGDIIACAIAVGIAVGGCSKTPNDDLQTQYGQRSETRFASSINGYGVLADMFAKAGHTVRTGTDLTPSLKDSADVIVYAPDDFNPPDGPMIDWFQQWLEQKEGRTLIYIGRDFDAAPIYWRKIWPQVAPKLQAEVDRRLAEATQEFNARRRAMSEDAACIWFSVDSTAKHRDVRKLGGPWSYGVDGAKVEIELNSRIETDDDAEILLTAPLNAADKSTSPQNADDILAFRRAFQSPNYQGIPLFAPTSQLIVVANGSFLVNLQLVNKEHRKLAAKLIDKVGQSKRVVFMEADEPTRIRNSGGRNNQETAGMTDVLGVWPLGVILIQWGIVMLLFCFSRWPIFGPPRDPPPAPTSDFARHVAALAENWELTRDSSYAKTRWQYYQEHVRGEPGMVVAAKRHMKSGK
ncbi:MAG TPA: hypothetical protein VGY55_05330 [Pirellulales bacterium]|nr:hypothetical protein [Pirellulales bacterium]